MLSDPQKKRIFDQTGSDPTSRINNASAASGGFPSSSFSGRSGFANNPFEDDLFNMFWWWWRSTWKSFRIRANIYIWRERVHIPIIWKRGADPFMRYRRTTRRPRAQSPNGRGQTGPNGEEQPSLFEALKGILPILMLLIVPILSAIFSGDTSPEYSFVPSQEYNIQRNTPKYNIPFYVTDKFQEKHGSKSKRQLRNYDSKVENLFISDKRAKCSKEQIHKDQLIEDAYGWFSVDSEKLQRAENFPTPNCDILKGLNLL